ncbi:MAG: hypothetical protein WKF89_16770 [Chitinophagaceae bacterium]
MTSFYKSYIRAFQKFAQAKLYTISSIIRYASILNLKANELLLRASLNKLGDLAKLQKELFETGRDYVKKFSLALKQRRNVVASPAEEKVKTHN